VPADRRPDSFGMVLGTAPSASFSGRHCSCSIWPNFSTQFNVLNLWLVVRLSQSRTTRSQALNREPWASTDPPIVTILADNRSTGVDRSTYYDSKKRMTASLIRARKPYLWKNFFMGIALSGIATGICSFVATV
jgi:hypothetical protein